MKYFIYFLTICVNKYFLYRNIRRTLKNTPQTIPVTKEKKQEYIKRWSKLGGSTSLLWYKACMNITGVDDTAYISEPDYYHKVELILNNKIFNYAYCDKNNYHKLIDNSILPKVYVRNIEGAYYNSDYKAINDSAEILNMIPEHADRVIVKTAVGSCGGKSIQLFRKDKDVWSNSSGEKLTVAYLETNYKKNFLIQEYIRQHPFYSKFNESSVNTIRLFTYRSVINNEIIVLRAMLRIGKKGSSVDNIFSGGICCNIDQDGKLGEYAIGAKHLKIYEFNDLVFKNVGKLYNIEEVKNTAKAIAGSFLYHRLIGFDFCVDENSKVILIEANLYDIGISHQMLSGPLFREYTDEIIEYCARNKKTISFDFDL
jgi:hypothetical protein